MRSACSLGLIAFLAACSQPAEDDANVAANAPMEIEAVPADESAVTPTEELENGTDEPDSTNLSNEL